MTRRIPPHHARPRPTDPAVPIAPQLGDHPCDPASQGPTPTVAASFCIAHAPHLDVAPADPGHLLDFQEARALLRVSRNTLYRLAAAGRLPGATKVGKSWRFHRALLLDWLAHPTQHPRPPRPSRPDLPVAPRRPGRAP